MKKSLLFFLLVFIFLVSGSLSIAQETIVLASGEWAPYFSKNLKHYGVISHIITDAFANEGIKVQFKFYPWKRSFELTKLGKFDGTPGWYKTPEREQWFYFSDALFTSRVVFFHLKSKPFQWDTIKDLSKFNIGAMLGYKYEPAFDQLAENGTLKVQRNTKEIYNFKKLLADRVDAFVCDIDVGYQTMAIELTKKEQQHITFHPKPLNTRLAYLLFTKKDVSGQFFLKAFNKGLKQLKRNGTYDNYLDRSHQGGYLLP